MNRIHIVGTGPRTGTTLMIEAMIACFRIDAHADHEARIFTKPTAPADVYLTKKVTDVLVAKPFLEAYRDLHVICLMRDPRDMIVSKHATDPDQGKPARFTSHNRRGTSPITPEGVGAWRSEPARVAGQLEIHGTISADLIEFGYERDASWLDELAEVVPDHSPAYWPEFFTRRIVPGL